MKKVFPLMSILVFGQQLSSGLSFKKGAENPEDSGHYPCMRDITRRASLDRVILLFDIFIPSSARKESSAMLSIRDVKSEQKWIPLPSFFPVFYSQSVL
ncbi:hypothetical protein TNCV_3848391 [Trichonephila clavipes]|uniref:Secreted protein n=1 Tax=Trichonephila clavipes TaxID=2585209 RepID=A0A8X6RDP0_TRICX|nr:hypothetical protein TNCV_3848391 [Trichonephila clavipes]